MEYLARAAGLVEVTLGLLQNFILPGSSKRLWDVIGNTFEVSGDRQPLFGFGTRDWSVGDCRRGFEGVGVPELVGYWSLGGYSFCGVCS